MKPGGKTKAQAALLPPKDTVPDPIHVIDGGA